MRTIKRLIVHLFFTRKELFTYLSIALPMVISQATDTLMFFTDRLFLTRYKEGQGEFYLNATLTGGITFFFLCGLFIIIANFTNTITAQYFGAKKYHQCAKVGIQSFYFGIFTFPLVLLLYFFVPFLFRLFNHNPIQNELQVIYTQMLILGGIFAIIRSGISGFFIGIGNTSIVMIANIIGLIINIPLNYMLINGVWIFPELGIVGAAIATILSSIVSLCIQLLRYFGRKIHEQYNTRKLLSLDTSILKKLIRFGTPVGIEALVGVGAFNYFVLLMNNYGTIVGSAVTIAINWDSMFFIPMIGAQFSTTSLVGRYMGAKDIKSVQRVARTSFTIIVLYALFVIACFLVFTHYFIIPFLSTMSKPDKVYPLAKIMVRTACIYLLADAANLTFTGVLKGAGDTKVSMYIFLSISIVFITVTYTLVQRNIVAPMGAWVIFIGYAFAIGIGMIIRYLQGKWKTIKVIEEEI